MDAILSLITKALAPCLLKLFNYLGFGFKPLVMMWPTVRRVDGILRLITKQCPKTQVVLLGLLPRGVPAAGGAIPWPSRYSRGLLATNARYEALAAKCALISTLNLNPTP